MKMHFISHIYLIVTWNILTIGNAKGQNQHESLSTMIERDLQASDLSEQFAAFKSKYFEQITSLGTKIDLFIQERNNNNNAMEVVAEMMKVVMKIQEQNKNIEKSLQELRTQVEQDRAETQQNILNLKSNVSSEIFQLKQQVDGEIHELFGALMKVNHTLLKNLETVETTSNEKMKHLDVTIQNITHTYINVNYSLSKKLEAIARMSNVHNQQLEAIRTKSNENIDVYRNTTNILNGRIKSLDDHIKNNHKRVGFTYRLNKPGIWKVNDTIHFSDTIADFGGGYNVSDGKFHCQHSGLYMFATTITSPADSLLVYIMKNGLRAGYTFGGRVESSDSFLTTVVIHLNVGDEVWVTVLKSAMIDGWSLFAGARISD